MAPIELTLRLLRLEALACEVSAFLGAGGAPVILCKGPVTNAWLYETPDARSFRDIDFLVRPSDAGAAHQLLEQHGFVNYDDFKLGIHKLDNETTWVRDDLVVDLHTRLVGVERDRGQKAAELLFADAEPFPLQGNSVLSLSETDRLMHLALHAAQSGTDDKAVADLSRGLDRTATDRWLRVRDRARVIGAEATVWLGLGRDPVGRALVEAWGPPPPARLEARLRLRGASTEAIVMAGLRARPAGSRMAEVRGWLRAEQPGQVTVRSRLSATARILGGVGEIIAEQVRHRLHPAT